MKAIDHELPLVLFVMRTMCPRWMNSLNLNALPRIEPKFSFMRKIHFQVRTIVLQGQCDYSNKSLQEALDAFKVVLTLTMCTNPKESKILLKESSLINN